jgi:hypothetical protein
MWSIPASRPTLLACPADAPVLSDPRNFKLIWSSLTRNSVDSHIRLKSYVTSLTFPFQVLTITEDNNIHSSQPVSVSLFMSLLSRYG